MSEEIRKNHSEMNEHHTSAAKNSRRKQRRLNNILMAVLCLVTAAVVVAMLLNMKNVLSSGSFETEPAAVETDTQKTMKNDLYEIGNNPSEIQKQYFQELTDAISSGDKQAYAEALVKCFAADYFSWQNKDGNYEVGGLQYVYGQKYLSLNDWSRWNYQADFDLYLNKYGKNNLPMVAEVTPYMFEKRDDFTVKLVDPQQTLPCYEVRANISYESTRVDLDDFVNVVAAIIVDNNGRLEIAEVYAYNN